MPRLQATAPVVLPFALIGRTILDLIRYLGGMGLLAMSAARSLVRPRGEPPPLRTAVLRQLDRNFRFGLPLVAIVHVGLGSFLAMQAYFGATFLDGIGPVVGVGLIRNVAPLMSGLIMAGLLGAGITAELRGGDREALDRDPNWLPDRDDPNRVPVEAPPPIEHGRLAAARMIAAAMAGPVMGIWGAMVGIAVGFGVGVTLMKVTAPGFFDLFLQMLWFRDVVGIFFKGILFGFVGSWFACYEGLRRPLGAKPDPARTPGVAVRAASLAGLAILVLNSAWFLLFYHAGPAFGPTLLPPPQL